MLLSQPFWRSSGGCAENDFDSLPAECRYGAVEEAEVVIALTRLHHCPAELANTHRIDAAFVHAERIILPVAPRPLFRIVAHTEEEICIAAFCLRVRRAKAQREKQPGERRPLLRELKFDGHTMNFGF